MNRRYIAAIAAAAVSAFAGTSANAATVVVPAGTADTVVDLADLTVSGLPVEGVSVGQVRSFASNDPNAIYNPVGKGKPFAMAKITLPDGSAHSVRSDGDSGAPGKTVPIAGLGGLTVGDLTATAGTDAAQSLVNAVEGELNGVIAGLKARAAGVNSKVGPDGSATTNGAVVENVSVGLTDVLPAELLAQLPLEKVIELAGALGVDVDLGPLNDAKKTVQDLAKTVDDVVDTQSKIEQAEAQIEVLRDTMGSGVGGAQDAVDEAQDAVDAAATELDELVEDRDGLLDQWADAGCATVSVLPGCDAIADQIDAVEDEIDAQTGDVEALQDVLEQAQTALAAAREGVAEIQKQIDALQEKIEELVAVIDGLLDKLIDLAKLAVDLDLEGLLAALLEGLEGVELIGVDRMSFGVSTMATAATSKASTLCDVSGVRILGEAHPVTGCQDVQQAVGQVEQTLKDVLAVLPIQGVVPADAVSVDGPRMTNSPEGHAAEGYRIATASVSGLDLNVAPINLTQVVDGLVVQARALVSGALDEIENLTGVEVPVDVDAALQDLLDKLNALPVGDTLDDVVTPAVSISAIDLGSRSTFRAAGSGSDVSPILPTGNLPHTGGGVGVALVLLALGGAAWAVIRPRRVGIEG